MSSNKREALFSFERRASDEDSDSDEMLMGRWLGKYQSE